MRALDSAIALSQRLDKPLYVLWRQDDDLNARFEDLFIAPESIRGISNVVLRGRSPLSAQLAAVLPPLFDKCIDQECVKSLRSQKYDFADLEGWKTIFISTSSRFYDAESRFRDLVPSVALQQVIHSYARELENAVGVHIRRTDNVRSIEKSPTAKFIEQMEKEIQLDDRVRFFLATDSPAEEAHLKAIFSDRIVTHPKRSLNRNDSIAAQDALIDLFCLSRCRKLVGSYWSSFSDTAGDINGIPRVIIRDS